MLDTSDYYKALGISYDATEKQIKSAYKKLALKWHPDKNPDNQEEAKENFEQISNVYETLINPEKRRVYNLTLNRVNTPNFDLNHFANSTNIFRKFNEEQSRAQKDEIPPYIYTFAENFGLDAKFVNECFLSNEKDGRYDVLFDMRYYLRNYKNKEQPAFSLEEVMKISREAIRNLGAFYELIKSKLISIDEAKMLNEDERYFCMEIWNREFTNPKRNELVIAGLHLFRKNPEEARATFFPEQYQYYNPNRNSNYDPKFSPFYFSESNKSKNWNYAYPKWEQGNHAANKKTNKSAVRQDPTPSRIWASSQALLLPNGNIIVGFDEKNQAFKVYNPITSDLIHKFSQHEQRVSEMTLLASGNIAVSSYDKHTDIKIFNPHTGELLRRLSYGEKPCLRLIAKNNLIITASNYRYSVVTIFDSTNGNVNASKKTNMTLGGLTATSKYIVTSGEDSESSQKCYQLYDENLTLVKNHVLNFTNAGIQKQILINDDIVAIADTRNIIHLYQLDTGQNIINLDTEMNAIRSLAMQDDKLLVADADGLISAYEPLSGKWIDGFRTNDVIQSPDVLKIVYAQLIQMFEPEIPIGLHDNLEVVICPCGSKKSYMTSFY